MKNFLSLSRIACLILLGLVLVLPTSHPAQALVSKTLKLSQQDLADLLRIEKALNSLTTMKGRFLQVASSGNYAEGDIYLSRPGRMRLDYDDPNPMLIIADGQFLIYHDRQTKNVTHMFISMTPASFLLSENIRFNSNDIIVTGFKRSPGVFEVSIVQADDPLEGSLTMVFSDKPMELRKWTITDSEGIQTSVSLLGPQYGHHLNPRLFIYEGQPPG